MSNSYIHRVYDIAYEELEQDPQNANLGTERGEFMLRESIQDYGPGRSILLDRDNVPIAGNKTLQAAVEAGIPVVVVESHGEAMIAVKRMDLLLADEDGKARGLALADNRTGEVNLKWDFDALQALSDHGHTSKFFRDQELEEMGVEVKGRRADFNHPTQAHPLAGDDAYVPGRPTSIHEGQVWVLGEHTLTIGRSSKHGEAEVMIRAWERYTGCQAQCQEFDEFGGLL